MSIKHILFAVLCNIIFLSTATIQWTNTKYLLNTTNIVKVIRKSNFHDYTFDDWEETTPLLYFDNPDETMKQSPAETASEHSTPAHGTQNGTGTIEATETATEVTAEDTTFDTTTVVGDYEEPQVPEVSPSNATVKDVLEHYLTTTEADIWTPDIHIINNTLSTIETQPTANPLLLETKAIMEAHKFGYYTALLIVFMRLVASLDEEHIEPLKTAVYQEVQGAQSRGRLSMFGPLAEAILLDIAEMIAQLPADQIKSQAIIYHSQYINRRTRFSPQTNAIFDVLDSSFETNDAMSVLSCLADIQAFPNVTKKPEDIAKDLFERAFYVPYSRMRGTAKEKILMLELENAIKNRMTGPGRRHQAKKTGPKQSKLVKSINNLNKTQIDKVRSIKQERQRQINKKGITKSNKNIRMFFYLFDDITFDTTKRTSTTDVDLDYLRNETIMEELKERMRLYKNKFRIIRKKENRTGIKRGKTTTTTTTTKKPKMRKSKYYIRKYVKKNLYKMKTTTPTTTTKKRWFRKWYHDNSSNCGNSNGMLTYQRQTACIKYVANNDSTDLMFNKGFRRITESSDYSIDEKDLKAKLLDAIVHGKEHDLPLFKDKRRYDRVKSFESYSNEEPFMRSNVYKALGYGNNFAERLKKQNIISILYIIFCIDCQ